MGQKSVLITGSSEGGIGDALARTFHQKGLLVFATARNLTKVQHLKELGLEILPLDVTDEASIKQAVESVGAATGGTLDILVNNSGGGYNMPLLDSQIAVAKEMFDVNVFALVAVTQAFAPLLIASKGTVVNIGSIVGKFPFPWQGFYNASKAAVNLLSDQLRIELSPFNVKVVNVVTGSVSTKFFDNLAKPPRLPEDSFYSSAKEDVEELMEGELASKNAMKVEVFAEGVANNAVGFGGEPISYFRLSHDFSPEIIRPLPKHHERAIANSPVTQLKSNPKRILWIGGEVVLIWIGTAFGWATIWDLILPRLTNLGLVKRKIRAASQPTSK